MGGIFSHPHLLDIHMYIQESQWTLDPSTGGSDLSPLKLVVLWEENGVGMQNWWSEPKWYLAWVGSNRKVSSSEVCSTAGKKWAPSMQVLPAPTYRQSLITTLHALVFPARSEQATKPYFCLWGSVRPRACHYVNFLVCGAGILMCPVSANFLNPCWVLRGVGWVCCSLPKSTDFVLQVYPWCNPKSRGEDGWVGFTLNAF